MLGQHIVGGKHAIRADNPLRDDALLLAEEIGKLAGIVNRHRLDHVGDDEAYISARALHDAVLLDEAAKTDALAGPQFAFRGRGLDLARRIEEHDRAA